MPTDDEHTVDDLDDSGNPRTVTLKRSDIRALERQAKKAGEYEAKIRDLERTQAFMAAGVPVDDPAAKYFVKGYDGDLNPDAIKAAAVEARIIQTQQISGEEQAGHEAAQAAAAGGTPPGNTNLEADIAKLRNLDWRDGDKAQAALMALAKEHGLRIPING